MSAANKSTGKSKQINITNKMNRLSQTEIDRMVQEAVKFRAEDVCLVDGADAEMAYAGFLEFKFVVKENGCLNRHQALAFQGRVGPGALASDRDHSGGPR